VFASDEEALAAVTGAYANYLVVSDNVATAGGQGVEALVPYVSNEYFEQSSTGFSVYLERDIHAVGASSFDSVSLQSHVEGSGSAEVVIYLCLDVSTVRIVDSSELDVTPANRRTRAPLEVEFLATELEPQPIIVRSDLWAGDDYCAV
jgi:hypothetical protein